MAKVLIAINERYPCFEFGKDKVSDTQVDVDKKTLAEWKATFKAFEKMQKAMKKLVDPSELEAAKLNREHSLSA